MLHLLHNKRNPIFTTVEDGGIFHKKFKIITSEKKVRRKYYFYSAISLIKL